MCVAPLAAVLVVVCVAPLAAVLVVVCVAPLAAVLVVVCVGPLGRLYVGPQAEELFDAVEVIELFQMSEPPAGVASPRALST